jgi:hypothetical protein
VFGTDDTDVIELSSVASGTGGFVINGEKAEDYSGISVSSAGDVNGDALSDLIVGAYGADVTGYKTNEGKSYVIYLYRCLPNEHQQSNHPSHRH